MMCLCKDCDYVDITTWEASGKYREIRLCQCCGGTRYIHHNRRRCPNYRGL